MATELKHITLIKKIASGAFGDIFLAHDTNTSMPVAVKLEKRSNLSQLKHEYNVYRLVKNHNVPKIYEYGKILFNNVYLNGLVMELLGKSLEQLFVDCNKKFTLKTVCMVSIRMIDNIANMHNKHFVHRDIKPDNFVFDIGCTNLYLIDFGLAKEFRDPVTLTHHPIRYDKSLTGTARYASLNTHKGIEQSRRDDLESIGHCLIYFLKGRLPWQGLRAENKQEKYTRIKECKENTKLFELCQDIPHEFYMYMFYVKHLGYDEWPNYCYLKDLFVGLLRKNGWKDDSTYDWTDINDWKVKKGESGIISDDYSVI